jgi:hypothetical protein
MNSYSIVDSANSEIKSSASYFQTEKPYLNQRENVKTKYKNAEKFNQATYESENYKLLKEINSLLMQPVPLPNYSSHSTNSQQSENNSQKHSEFHNVGSLSQPKIESTVSVEFKKHLESNIDDLRMKVSAEDHLKKKEGQKKRTETLRKEKIKKIKSKGEDISSENLRDEVEDDLFEITEYVPFFDRNPVEKMDGKNKFMTTNYSLEKDNSNANVIESPFPEIMEALTIKQRRAVPPPSSTLSSLSFESRFLLFSLVMAYYFNYELFTTSDFTSRIFLPPLEIKSPNKILTANIPPPIYVRSEKIFITKSVRHKNIPSLRVSSLSASSIKDGVSNHSFPSTRVSFISPSSSSSSVVSSIVSSASPFNSPIYISLSQNLSSSISSGS